MSDSGYEDRDPKSPDYYDRMTVTRGEKMAAATKGITPKDIRKAFEGIDDPAGRKVQAAEDKELRELAEKLSSPDAIRAAVGAVWGD